MDNTAPIEHQTLQVGFGKKYLELVRLATKTRMAQRDYVRTNNKQHLQKQKELERDLDKFLLETNKAENLQTSLF